MSVHEATAVFPRQRLISLESAQEWRATLAPLPHTFAHTWDHCYAMQLSSGLPTHLYSVETGTASYVCPIAERIFDGAVDVVTPYGFSGFTGDGGDGGGDELPGLWRAFARERGYVAGFLMQSPVLGPSPYALAGEAYSHKHVFVLDLTLPVEELHVRLHENRRRQLRGWSDIAAELVVDEADVVQFLLDNYQDFFRLRNAASVYNFAPESLSFLAGLDNVVLIGATDGGRIQAASMFGYTATGADYLFNVSTQEGRRHSASLIWCAVHFLQSLGVPLLNLGGGVTEGDGIAGFKQRFGAARLPLTYLKQVYDQDTYARLCATVGADPGDRAGYFPAYRRR